MKTIKEILYKFRFLIVIYILLAILFRTVFSLSVISSGSMEPTLPVGDIVMGTRIFDSIDRGDIVVFKADRKLIKRVIGIEGDRIEIRDNKIYLNGEELNEDYLKEDMVAEDKIYIVPEGCIFVLGDNRNDSIDSRYWEDPYVKCDKVISKALFIIYPITEMQRVH